MILFYLTVWLIWFFYFLLIYNSERTVIDYTNWLLSLKSKNSMCGKILHIINYNNNKDYLYYNRRSLKESTIPVVVSYVTESRFSKVLSFPLNLTEEPKIVKIVMRYLQQLTWVFI